jgi:uncharacterized protein (DUF1697 family)
MKKNKYLVLSRGINVGGNNIIKMDELKKLFEEAGFTNVLTYIQSGNIIFDDFEKDKIKLAEKIENVLYKKMENKITIALLTFSEIKKVINKKPEGFGEEKDKYKYDVIFLIEPLKTKEAVKEIKTREGVDEMYEGEKVIYIRRLIEELSKSHFPKIAETVIYKNITVRNWNTTKELYELLNKNNNEKD